MLNRKTLIKFIITMPAFLLSLSTQAGQCPFPEEIVTKCKGINVNILFPEQKLGLEKIKKLMALR